MAPESPYQQLTRRERQIMDILYRLGEGSAEDVRSRLPDPPSYSAARAMLVKLEEKGQVTHFERDLRYVYRPAVAREEVRQSVLGQVVETFFEGSVTQAVTGLLSQSDRELPEEELDRLAGLIDDARKRTGRNGEER